MNGPDDAAQPSNGPSQTPVVARYQLPTHIWVDNTVLGTVTATRIGGVAAQVHVPRLTASGSVVAPVLPGIPTETLERTDGPWTERYAATTDDPHAVALHVIALELSEDPATPLGHVPYAEDNLEERIIAAAGTNITAWFDILRTWLELHTAQDLDHRNPVYDATTIGPGFEAWHNGSFVTAGSIFGVPRINAVSQETWRDALANVAADRHPPGQWVAARDANAAYLRDDHRKAVLDAATSAEMTLAHLYDQEWPRHAEQSPLAPNRQSIDGYMKWLASKQVTLAANTEQITELRTARNDAIHTGASATKWIALNAVRTAYSLATQHIPLRP